MTDKFIVDKTAAAAFRPFVRKVDSSEPDPWPALVSIKGEVERLTEQRAEAEAFAESHPFAGMGEPLSERHGALSAAAERARHRQRLNTFVEAGTITLAEWLDEHARLNAEEERERAVEEPTDVTPFEDGGPPACACGPICTCISG